MAEVKHTPALPHPVWAVNIILTGIYLALVLRSVF